MFLLFMFAVLSFSVEGSQENSQSSFDSILRAQCQAKCIEKFGHNFVKRTKSGQSYEQVRCNGTCQPCWLGCVLRVQTEDLCQKKCLEAKDVVSCNQGCKYQFELLQIVQYNNNVPIYDDYGLIDSLSLLCQNMKSKNDVFGRFVISINSNHSSINTSSLAVVFVIQAQQRAFSITYRQYTITQWHSLGTRIVRTFVLKQMLPGMEYRFRVIAVHSNGTLGEFVNSDWIRTISANQILNKPIQLALSQQLMTGNELNAVIDWQADHYYPTCFYHIVWHNTNMAHSRSIIVDESMSYMLSGLDYGSNYTVTIRSLSDLTHPREESQPIGLMFTSLDCLHVHNYNFSICGPGPVTNLEYKRVNSTLNLTFSQPKYTTPWNRVLAYLIYYRSLPHMGSCKNNVEKSLRIEPNKTSICLNVSSNCYYQASITAIGQNDKSGVVSYISFNYSILSSVSSLSDVQSVIPFHPAYFIVVLISVLVLVSVIGFVYLRLNKSVTQVNKKNPLVHQISALISKTLYRNSQYADTSMEVHPSVLFSPVTMNTRQSLSRVSSVSTSTVVVDPNRSSLSFVNHNNLIHFLSFKQKLGAGQFGSVYKATCSAPAYPAVVAVKRVKDENNKEALCHLEQEAEMMKWIGDHQHIVRLLAVIPKPHAIVMEYCNEGNLKQFLINLKKQAKPSPCRSVRKDSGIGDNSPVDVNMPNIIQICPSLFLSYARQIAMAMEFLSSKGMVHRDLAARNILVCEGGTLVKVCDFGLTRNGGQYQQIVGGQLPVKWMAPEAIRDQIFTQQSDVWSFGIVLWEIMSVGDNPYPDVSMPGLLDVLNSGYRNPQPSICSDQLYELMLLCWSDIPLDRPSFSTLRCRLEVLMESGENYIGLQTNTIYYQDKTQNDNDDVIL